MLKVLDVDGAVQRVRGGWVATGQEWSYDAERYAKVTEVRRDEQRAMREYLTTGACRMRYLREQLDDPAADDCGRCDNCGGLSLPSATSEQTVAAAGAALGRPGVPFEARRMWPTAMPALGIDVRGKIPAGEQAEEGRAVARYTDLGFGARVRSVLGPEAADDGVPDDLVRAVVQVLGSWGWAQRPAAVVHVGSLRRPGLVAGLAARIGEIGRLPHLGGVEHSGASSAGRSNSALRLRDVWGGYQLPDVVAAALSGQPLLLVDDYTDTGWTLTVVARLLRRGGAGAVYPLVLGIAG
jgi:ATP-dependent DNA helicase RecQ